MTLSPWVYVSSVLSPPAVRVSQPGWILWMPNSNSGNPLRIQATRNTPEICNHTAGFARTFLALWLEGQLHGFTSRRVNEWQVVHRRDQVSLRIISSPAAKFLVMNLQARSPGRDTGISNRLAVAPYVIGQGHPECRGG